MKTWYIRTIVALIIVLIMFAALTIVIDPYFHYHKPFGKYILNNERYQNFGIVKHFNYDAIITGTSMTEKFKVTEFNELFDVNSIKVPFSGGAYREPRECLNVAYKSNNNIKYVIRSLDIYSMTYDSSYRSTTFNYPDYLYDNNIFNDVYYLFNKDILANYTLSDLAMSIKGVESTTFDKYAIWTEDISNGRESILKQHKRQKDEFDYIFTDETKEKIIKNLDINVASLALEHPNTTFLIFIPPYSICAYDSWNYNNAIDYYLKVQEVAIKYLLNYSNIKLYSWSDNKQLVTDLNNYNDANHYNSKINSQILMWMKNDYGLLTKDNYQKYLEKINYLYKNYDYDSVFGK